MNEWFKIIVYILEHMLHVEKPLFDKPKKISVYISDNVREITICWSPSTGAYFSNFRKENK